MTSCLSNLGTFAALIAAGVKLAGWSDIGWSAVIIIWTVPTFIGFAIDMAIVGTAALRDRRERRREDRGE